MELHIGVSKINKYATSESGDTLEFIERPGGGISVVLVDGQMSGKSAKAISNKVVRKMVSLLADGVRDGAAARAASDYLYHERKGKVQATLNVISVDLISKTLVITRNNPAPVYVYCEGKLESHNEESQPVGIYLNTRPVISEIPITRGVTVFMFSDGVTNAGVRQSKTLDLPTLLQELAESTYSAQELADLLLSHAMELDQQRPVDDISIVVVRITEKLGDNVRRATIRLPLETM